MGLRSTLEVLTHLRSFKNIEMARQGAYQLKVKIFQTLDNNVDELSQPYQ